MVRLFESTAITSHKEPRGRYVNSEDRSDIVVFDLASGVDLELDIALAHPGVMK